MTSTRLLFHILLLFLISYSGSPAETECQKPSVVPFANMTFPRSPFLPNSLHTGGIKHIFKSDPQVSHLHLEGTL